MAHFDCVELKSETLDGPNSERPFHTDHPIRCFRLLKKSQKIPPERTQPPVIASMARSLGACGSGRLESPIGPMDFHITSGVRTLRP